MGQQRVVGPAGNQGAAMRQPRFDRAQRGIRLIVAAAGNDLTDPVARVGHVAGVAGNQMDVEMPDGLTSGDPDVEADVVAVRSVVVLDDLLGRFESRV